jgi:hypothetical protein
MVKSKGANYMTGRDLILYILENKLEDELVIKDGVFIGLMSDDEVAIKFGVGVSTIRAYHTLGMLDGIEIMGRLYFLRNVKDPKEKDDKND